MSNRNTSRYLELAHDIASKIYSGDYPVGADLPTEAQFCDRYSVSRFTVREALRRLETAGLIAKQQGRGSRVIAARSPATFVMIGPSADGVLRYTEGTRVEYRKVGSKVSAQTARKLRLGDPKDWVAFHGQRWGPKSDQPIAVHSIYMRAQYAQAVRGEPGPLSSLSSRVVEHWNLHLTQVEQFFTAVSMPASAARQLKCEPDAPALQLIRRFSAEEASPFEVTVTLHAQDVELALVMEPHDQGGPPG